MSISSLYKRLLVAAGAVAFFVVNWFCRPARRQPSHEPEVLETAPEQKALLEAVDEEDRRHESKDAPYVGSDKVGYKAPELSQLDAHRQFHEDAALVPDEVILETLPDISSVTDHPFEHREQENLLQSDSHPTSSTAAASGKNTETLAFHDPNNISAVDENYLKSLLDKELGGPKFAIRKPTPGAREQQLQPTAEDRSLQDLLDQAFGPPRFAVPKPPLSRTPDANKDLGGGARALPGASAPTGSQVVDVAPAALAARSCPGVSGGDKRRAEELEQDAAAGTAENASCHAPEGALVLSLHVTQGPASGKCAVADKSGGEYLIGRLPESWLQILDQEVSGRHAAVRWDAALRRWMLRDVGSLNGTALRGEPINREYKVPGEERPLADGDMVQLGSSTLLKAELLTTQPEQVLSGLTTEATAKRHDASSLDGNSDFILDRSQLETVGGLPGLPTPGLVIDCPQQGVRLCVHNKLGIDHKRLCQGCEDVPHWELPFEPYGGAGIICIFDGHHGSKAANQAKEYLPAILRTKLLGRDGRQAPELPRPPTPLPPRWADGEEEEIMETYDGSSGEELVGEESSERSHQEQLGAQAKEASSKRACARGGDGDSDKNGKHAVAEHKPSGAAMEEQDQPPAEELSPPPPAGPPLPPLLRGRDVDSQRALLRDTFLLTDKYMPMEEGCTATVVLLDTAHDKDGWILQSGNVGDSSAVLVNFTRGCWCKLSEDHRIASSSSERQRLAAMGHIVRNRLYGLNISRMLGDRFLKEENLGFLAEPYVSVAAQVGPGEHAVLVVASDGLWDVLPEDRAAMLLLQEAARSSVTWLRGGQGPQNSAAFRSSLSANQSATGAGLASPPAGAAPTAATTATPPSAAIGCQAVADLLLTKALVMRSKDDITIAVLEMGPHLRPQNQQRQ